MVYTVIRFSSTSYPDLELPEVPPQQLTLSWLRKRVRSKLSDLKSRRLRFILSGRVITDATNLGEDYQRHVRFQSQDDTLQDNKFYIHCLIGDALSPVELQKENELDNKVQQPSTTPAPVGFDRLASAGFSAEDITALRRQFRQLYGDLPQGENNDLRQLEERWIDSSVNHEVDDFNMATAGTGGSVMDGNADLLLGVLIGCLLGVLSVFVLLGGKLFTKRQKMSIFAGLVINFCFAIVRQWS